MSPAPAAPPRLYHAASSYYSSVARLALVEAGVAFTPVPTDIHWRKANLRPEYVRRFVGDGPEGGGYVGGGAAAVALPGAAAAM